MQEVWCTECGAEHWDRAARCSECGGALVEQPSRPPPEPLVDRARGIAERDLASLDAARSARIVQNAGGGSSHEGADPDFDLGGAVRRMCAAAIDLLLLVPLLSLLLRPLLTDPVRDAADSETVGWVAASLLTDVVIGAYFVIFAVVTGVTIGKRLMGLRVVALDGRPVGWRRAGIRYGVILAAVAAPEVLAVAGVSAEVSAMAWVVSLAVVFGPIALSDDGTGLQDRLSGTRVVRTSS